MNENCLEGMRCPSCGSEGPFTIVVTALSEVSDDGTENFADVDWGDGSRIWCQDCEWNGVAVETKLPNAVLVDDLLGAADDVLRGAADSGTDTDEETGETWPDFAALNEAYSALRPDHPDDLGG